MSARRFLDLHQRGSPFVIANPWDVGSARMLAASGFSALATSSAACAMTLGRSDYSLQRGEAIAHAEAIVQAVDIPVSADLENGFGAAPEAVATTIEQAVGVGLAGGSIEDYSGDSDDPLYEESLAVERISAAVEAARKALR